MTIKFVCSCGKRLRAATTWPRGGWLAHAAAPPSAFPVLLDRVRLVWSTRSLPVPVRDAMTRVQRNRAGNPTRQLPGQRLSWPIGFASWAMMDLSS